MYRDMTTLLSDEIDITEAITEKNFYKTKYSLKNFEKSYFPGQVFIPDFQTVQVYTMVVFQKSLKSSSIN